MKKECENCGKAFGKNDNVYIFNNGFGNYFCSLDCLMEDVEISVASASEVFDKSELK